MRACVSSRKVATLEPDAGCVRARAARGAFRSGTETARAKREETKETRRHALPPIASCLILHGHLNS